MSAAALINPATTARAVVAAGERRFGSIYAWTERSRAEAGRLDFVHRSPEIAARNPQVPILFVVGENDDPAFKSATTELRDNLVAAYAKPEEVDLQSVPGLAHALAVEPGIEAAPQTPAAAQVDAAVTTWLKRHVAGS